MRIQWNRTGCRFFPITCHRTISALARFLFTSSRERLNNCGCWRVLSSTNTQKTYLFRTWKGIQARMVQGGTISCTHLTFLSTHPLFVPGPGLPFAWTSTTTYPSIQHSYRMHKYLVNVCLTGKSWWCLQVPWGYSSPVIWEKNLKLFGTKVVWEEQSLGLLQTHVATRSMGCTYSMGNYFGRLQFKRSLRSCSMWLLWKQIQPSSA